MSKRTGSRRASLVGWFLFVFFLTAVVAAAMNDNGFVAALRQQGTWVMAAIMAIISLIGTYFGSKNQQPNGCR